jgi:glycogen debranching enzyme
VEYAYTRKSVEYEKFKSLILKFSETIERDHGGLVPEIFSGDVPHAPAGCVHQAWSAGELIRLLRKFEI